MKVRIGTILGLSVVAYNTARDPVKAAVMNLNDRTNGGLVLLRSPPNKVGVRRSRSCLRQRLSHPDILLLHWVSHWMRRIAKGSRNLQQSAIYRFSEALDAETNGL
jgi:hypothetical protein